MSSTTASVTLTTAMSTDDWNGTMEDDKLLERMGPRRDRLYVVVPVSICYLLIFTTGVLGNVCTCIIIGRTRSMHTATNFYLFSLAISDLLLLLLGLPIEFYELWYRYPYVFGNTMCVVRGLGAETSANASILTITAFTVERYLAICKPLSSHAFLSSPSRATRYVIIVWVMATLLALPLALQFGVIYETSPTSGERLSSSATCTVKYPLRHSFEVMSVLLFFLPMSVLTIIYIKIARQLRRTATLGSSGTAGRSQTQELKTASRRQRNRFNVDCAGSTVQTSVHLKPPMMTATTMVESNERRNTSPSRSSNSGSNDVGNKSQGRRQSTASAVSSRRSVFKMLVAVVVAFFVCWAPHHTQRIFSAIVVNNENLRTKAAVETYYVMTYVSGVMFYLSATINPIVYNAMSDRYRTAFLDLVRRTWRGITCRSRGQNRVDRPFSWYSGQQLQLSRRPSPSMPSTTSVAMSRTTGMYNSIELVHLGNQNGKPPMNSAPIVTTTPPNDPPPEGKTASDGRKTRKRMDGGYMVKDDVWRKNSGSISNSSLQLVESDDQIELQEYVYMMEQQR